MSAPRHGTWRRRGLHLRAWRTEPARTAIRQTLLPDEKHRALEQKIHDIRIGQSAPEAGPPSPPRFRRGHCEFSPAPSNAAPAQVGFPSRPLRLVHAFAPGSGTDNTGRTLADRLSARLGQPVVVENKPGANMIIGTEYAARQPADGHTLIMVTIDNLGINPNLYRNPGYSVSDFDPLTLIGFLPLVLVTPANSRFDSFEQLRRQVSASGQSAFFGTWGVGSVAHMYGSAHAHGDGLNLEFVPASRVRRPPRQR